MCDQCVLKGVPHLRAASDCVRPCVVDDTSSSTTSSGVSMACHGTSSSSELSMIVTAMWPSVLLLAGTYCVERLAMLIMDACEGVSDKQRVCSADSFGCGMPEAHTNCNQAKFAPCKQHSQHQHGLYRIIPQHPGVLGYPLVEPGKHFMQ